MRWRRAARDRSSSVFDGKRTGLAQPDSKVASKGGAPKHPEWYYNLKADPEVEIRDGIEIRKMRVREVVDPAEREQVWSIAVEAFPNYQAYQAKIDRLIPVFVAEPVE